MIDLLLNIAIFLITLYIVVMIFFREERFTVRISQLPAQVRLQFVLIVVAEHW